ncbi:MAG: type II secretion system F family protein, partial [Bdellovibrionaceae bacterium]|nr:type II secretion system F family protein [Pseudobdellovibrionaceae bacterium]
GKKYINHILRVLPLFSKIQYEAGMVRFFRSFRSLLGAGVNFLQALDISYSIADHKEVQKGIKIARAYVLKGKSFSQGLLVSKAFPTLVSEMAQIGEQSSKIENSLENLTTYYEDNLDNLTSSLIKMIEPLLIVFLGVIIGTIILGLYLPIFKMGELF